MRRRGQQFEGLFYLLLPADRAGRGFFAWQLAGARPVKLLFAWRDEAV